MIEKPATIIAGPLIWNEDGEVIDSNLSHMAKTITEAQRDKDVEYYEPKIEQARQEVAEDIGGLTCCLIGNLMLEDKEAGILLGSQLQPLIDTIKLRYLPHLPRKEESPDLEFNHEIHDKHGW